jgi:valyl-tRNA synthetase
MHPITPFITAELWERVAVVAGRKVDASEHGIVCAPYPKAQLERVDPKADAWVARLKAIVGSSRNLRSEMSLPPGERVPLNAIGDDAFVREATPLLKSLARLSEVTLFGDDASFADASSDSPVAVVGTMRLALHVKIDRAAETARLGKEIDRLDTEIAKATAKLADDRFVGRAPAAVVDQERKRVAEFTATANRLRDQRARLGSSK